MTAHTDVPQIQVITGTPPAPRAPRQPARRRVSWDATAGFGPVTGTIAAALGVLAIGVLGHDVAHLPPTAGFFGAGILAVFSLIAAAVRHYTAPAVVFRFAAFMLAGLWLYAAWRWAPWNATLLIVLGVAAAGMGTVGFIARQRRTAEELEAKLQAAAEEIHERDQRAAEWIARIIRVGGNKFDGVRILNIDDWDEGDGFTIDGDCPTGGIGWVDLAQIAYQLGVDVPLAKGCEIEVDEGENQRAFIMRVPTKDSFGVYRLTDDPIVPASILNGLSLGTTRTREDGVISVRESSSIVVGVPGSGKTTLLNRLVLRIALCTDAVPILIDMNRAAMGVAWCRAWWEGKAPYPPVAAIAGDAVEAELLTRFLFGVAMGRKQRSDALKMEHDTTLMPIGNGAPGNPPPLIVPIYDESAELIGAGATPDGMDWLEAQELMKSVMRYVERTLQLARDAGVRPILSALRAVDGFVGADLMAMCSNRVALRLPTDADHGNLFGWTASKTLRSTPQTVRKGAGWFAHEFGQPITAFQCPDLTPKQVRQYSIDIANAGIGPWDLTEEDIADGEAFAGEGAWTQRWERAAKWFGGRERGDYVAPQGPARPVVTMTKDEPARGEEQPDGSSLADAMQDLDDAEAALHAALAGVEQAPAVEATLPDRGGSEPTDEADAAELANLYRLWSLPSVDPQQQVEEPVAANWKDRVLQLLDKAGAEGAAPKALATQLQREGKGTNRQTVNEWLSEESKSGERVVLLKRGTYALRKHVPDAEQ